MGNQRVNRALAENILSQLQEFAVVTHSILGKLEHLEAYVYHGMQHGYHCDIALGPATGEKVLEALGALNRCSCGACFAGKCCTCGNTTVEDKLLSIAALLPEGPNEIDEGMGNTKIEKDTLLGYRFNTQDSSHDVFCNLNFHAFNETQIFCNIDHNENCPAVEINTVKSKNTFLQNPGDNVQFNASTTIACEEINSNAENELQQDNEEVHVGNVVETHGLHGAKELNGRRGQIAAFVQESSRLGVILEGGEDTKAIKPVNLREIETFASSLPQAPKVKSNVDKEFFSTSRNQSGPSGNLPVASTDNKGSIFGGTDSGCSSLFGSTNQRGTSDVGNNESLFISGSSGCPSRKSGGISDNLLFELSLALHRDEEIELQNEVGMQSDEDEDFYAQFGDPDPNDFEI